MNENDMSDNRFDRHSFCFISGKILSTGTGNLIYKRLILIASFLFFSACIHSAGAETVFTVPDAYQDFLFNDGYKHAGQQFHDENEVIITMWDLDEDDSAELLMYNGGEQENAQAVYVYTVKNGSVLYAGDVRCLYPDEGISAAAGIKGLALYDYDFETEQDIALMLTLENNTLQTTKLSIDDAFGSYLHWYKLQSLPSLGWEAFRFAPFILEVLDVDLNLTPEEYIANTPLTVSLSVKNGTPPYNISYWFENVDEEESYVLESGQCEITDRNYRFSYVPESGKHLWLHLSVTDLYGTSNAVQDPYELELKEGRNQPQPFTLMSENNDSGIREMNGTGFTNKARVNVRSGPDQNSEIVTQWTRTWSPITVTGYTTDKSGTGWYRIVLPNQRVGFIREDLLDLLSADTTT